MASKAAQTTWVRIALVTVLLGTQLVAIGYARTADTRYLAWAPYDQISLYDVEVTQGGVALAPAEVVQRYPLGLWVEAGQVRGRENRSIDHVHHLIDRIEQRRSEGHQDGDGDSDTMVVVRSSVNGAPPEVWSWPPS